jgi:hypothetical protein
MDNVRWFSPSLRSADRHGHQAPSRRRTADEHADLAAQHSIDKIAIGEHFVDPAQVGAAALAALPT